MSAANILNMWKSVGSDLGNIVGHQRDINAVTEQLLANDWADRGLVAGADTRKATRKEAKRLLRLGEIAPTLGASVGARDVLATGPADDDLRRKALRTATEAQIAQAEWGRQFPAMTSPTAAAMLRSMTDFKRDENISERDRLNREANALRNILELTVAANAAAKEGLSSGNVVNFPRVAEVIGAPPDILQQKVGPNVTPNRSWLERLFTDPSNTSPRGYSPDGRPLDAPAVPQLTNAPAIQPAKVPANSPAIQPTDNSVTRAFDLNFPGMDELKKQLEESLKVNRR